MSAELEALRRRVKALEDYVTENLPENYDEVHIGETFNRPIHVLSDKRVLFKDCLFR